MKNTHLLSILITLLGFSILLTISLFSKPIELNISNINVNHLNKEVKITGNIIQTKPIYGYNFTILTLEDKTGKINITVEKTLNKNQLTHKSSTIIGKVTSYKNEYQVQAKKIIL